MRRFYLEKVNKKNGYCIITGSEARHITKVLRMVSGDRFVLMVGEGKRFQALIESIESDKIIVTLEKRLPAPSPSPIEIILCQSILRSNPMDHLIQKTSELGVNRIIPFSSTRTIVRLKGERADSRLRHWRKIAQSSAKQSDRFTPITVETPMGFHGMINGFKNADALKIIMWEEETSRDLKNLLKKSLKTQKIVYIVGPEGGFTREEIDYAMDSGFISISLGNRILRAETAAITITAITQYEWGDLGVSIKLHG